MLNLEVDMCRRVAHSTRRPIDQENIWFNT